MAFVQPQMLSDLAVAIIEKLGKRVILSGGWIKVEEFDNSIIENENLLLIQEAPYDLLFLRCSTIVHQGGAGTTGTALIVQRVV